jgi:hypothetical protein
MILIKKANLINSGRCVLKSNAHLYNETMGTQFKAEVRLKQLYEQKFKTMLLNFGGNPNIKVNIVRN